MPLNVIIINPIIIVMLRSFKLLLLGTFYVGLCAAQKYDDVRPEQKEIYFAEECNEWELHQVYVESNCRCTVNWVSGHLLVVPKRFSGMITRVWNMTYSGIPEDMDWEFEIKFAYTILSKSKYIMQFKLGRRDHGKDKDNIFMWIYNPKARYIFETPYSKRSSDKLKGKLRDHLHEVESNKITVRRINDQYLFFINEWFCGVLDYSPLEASGVIELEFRHLNLDIDYIRVSKLNLSE